MLVTNSLTDSLTDCCLVNLIDVTLACEDGTSKSCYRTRVRSLVMLVSDSLTHSLTDCCLVNLIGVTLACEDAYSKLVEAVTVASVSDENRVGDSLL